MTLDLLSHYHGHHERAKRLPAPLKLGAALVVIIGTVVMPLSATAWFVGVALALLLAMALGGVSPLFCIKRLLVLSPLVLGVALVNASQPAGRGHWLAVAARSALCLLTVILVSNTTPFSDILRALKSVRVPALLITTIALMHRYLFVLVDESERMGRARASRTFTPGQRFHWSAMATVVGQLFVRASERAERIYDAMCARGWK